MSSCNPPLLPDTTLYIYYLQGVIPKDFPLNHRAFLGNWEEEGFSFLFFLENSGPEVAEIVSRVANLQLLDQYEMTYREWQGGQTDRERVGSFVLQPPWDKHQCSENEICIHLDSGVVFGNGTHPTTRDCLEAMELVMQGGMVRTMMDLGTGTGILAIAAAKLGCQKCLAVDFNHLAAQTTYRNIALNDMTKKILVVSGKAEELLSRPTDLLVANIHHAVMRELIELPGFLLQKWFILSGLLNSEAQLIRETLEDKPVHILKHYQQGGVWNTFLGITEQQ